jgi:hypothetical protein
MIGKLIHSVVILLTGVVVSGCTLMGDIQPLGTTLGRQRIITITQSEFDNYRLTRSRLERPIVADKTFWSEITPVVENTYGPRETAESFLKQGFRAFLVGLDEFLERVDRTSQQLIANAAAVRSYIAEGRETCAGSPCKVPPCGGDGVRCWKRKAN